MRNPGRCEKFFTSHNGPTFSIDWHPEDKNWIASAGRDKVIKVNWNLCKVITFNPLTPGIMREVVICCKTCHDKVSIHLNGARKTVRVFQLQYRFFMLWDDELTGWRDIVCFNRAFTRYKTCPVDLANQQARHCSIASWCLVMVMVRCHLAVTHYLSQCWPNPHHMVPLGLNELPKRDGKVTICSD